MLMDLNVFTGQDLQISETVLKHFVASGIASIEEILVELEKAAGPKPTPARAKSTAKMDPRIKRCPSEKGCGKGFMYPKTYECKDAGGVDVVECTRCMHSEVVK